MADKEKINYDFSDKTIKRRRSFPKKRAILLAILILLQALCVFGIFTYEPSAPSPQDVIDKYKIFVTPRDDGSLDIEYNLKWTPLDPDEPLTFIYIGMANPDYSIIDYSDNIAEARRYDDSDGEHHIDLHLTREYYKDDTLEISLTINQRYMLFENDEGCFFEFVPSWFNATPITYYKFCWKELGGEISTNADKTEDGWHIWEGSMDPGSYRMLRVGYESFDAPKVDHKPFNSDSVRNNLVAENKAGFVIVMVMIIIFLFVFEIFCFDTIVSYHRGRGFIYGYGHPMYIYGRRNRHYIDAEKKHNASQAAHFSSGHGGSGGHGGSCACACACACAVCGGGS